MGLNGYCPPQSGLEILLLESRFSNMIDCQDKDDKAKPDFLVFPTGVRDRSDLSLTTYLTHFSSHSDSSATIHLLG